MKHPQIPGNDETNESKSARKRAALDVQDLGEQLLALNRQELERLSLPDDLLEALRAAGSISTDGARRRHRQYIGKLMRGIDPEPIRQALALRAVQGGENRRLQQDAETWRDRLLGDGSAGFDEFMKRYPNAGRTRILACIRDATAPSPHTATTAKRTLFREIRRLISADHSDD